jgi:trimeric autotransporter adhesin
MRKNVVRNAVLVSLFAGMVVGNTYAFDTSIINNTSIKATTDVSPVDKKASEDTNGKIYNANSTRYNKQYGYFWTNLGHATIKDYDGNDVDLYTPFIYHTENNVWDTSATNYDPVHKGDGSEMKCQESMADISVGEFDRIVKALYTNDVTVYNAINGGYDESGKKVDGLKQKLFTEITSSTKDNVTTYNYLNAKGDVIGTTKDTDTKVVDNQIDFFNEKGEITSTITTSDGKVYKSTTGSIASRDYVDQSISNLKDNDTTITDVATARYPDGTRSKTCLKIHTSDGNCWTVDFGDLAYQSEVDTQINKVYETRITNLENKIDNFEDTNTVTTVSGDGFINVYENAISENKVNYSVWLNTDKLHDCIKDLDSDTITTVEGGTGIEVVSGETETGINYTINLDENVVKEIVKTVDTNTIITNADTDRNSDKGTATITLTNNDGGKVATTISDIASKKALDDYKSYNEFDKDLIKTVVTNDNRRINNLESRVDQLDINTKEVGAHAAALAALHPLDFDEDEKLSFAAGYGNYRGKNAVALGAFYRPNEDTMINFGGTFGSGDGMINLGVSFKLGPTATNKKSKKQLIEEVDDLKAQVAELHEAVAALLAK